THSNEVQCFDSSIKIPAMDDGMIINICDDFLGQTLVIEHKNSKALACRILFAYSHIIPEKDVNIDLAIKKEDIIATVCDTRKNPQLPPHLHFSCFEVSKQVLPRHLNWNLFSNCRELNVIHPCFL
ncbi:MAG: M23 family metallopeptidase, partial [Proteobacteria bacterium]|nr:M23 family metallopeptidase [Pseudomonadota bacterium]MBU1585564.1 M23 family metallopeptidase [Pseudomonadota bacterium]MBU2452976.1 M23 family metallopeptidase [Pseudomonadota bacterium]